MRNVYLSYQVNCQSGSAHSIAVVKANLNKSELHSFSEPKPFRYPYFIQRTEFRRLLLRFSTRDFAFCPKRQKKKLAACLTAIEWADHDWQLP